MQDPNLPMGYADRDVDGAVITGPDELKIHGYVCDNWRELIDKGVFEDVEVDRSYDDGETDVLVTVRVGVDWQEVNQ